jgi:hypothetical protein
LFRKRAAIKISIPTDRMSVLSHKLAISIVSHTCSIKILQRDIVFYLGLQLSQAKTYESRMNITNTLKNEGNIILSSYMQVKLFHISHPNSRCFARFLSVKCFSTKICTLFALSSLRRIRKMAVMVVTKKILAVIEYRWRRNKHYGLQNDRPPV